MSKAFNPKTFNLELAEKVLDQITCHPETHDQRVWSCGTQACIAGWTNHFATDGQWTQAYQDMDADRRFRYNVFVQSPGDEAVKHLGLKPGVDHYPFELFGGGQRKTDARAVLESWVNTTRTYRQRIWFKAERKYLRKQKWLSLFGLSEAQKVRRAEEERQRQFDMDARAAAVQMAKTRHPAKGKATKKESVKW